MQQNSDPQNKMIKAQDNSKPRASKTEQKPKQPSDEHCNGS